MIFIQQILVLSNQGHQMYETVECLKQSEIAVSIFPFSLLENKQNAFVSYQFIIIHFENDDHMNYEILKFIKRNSACPVFVLFNKHNLDEVRNCLENGAEGFFTLEEDCSLIASKIKAVIRYVDKRINHAQKVIQVDDLIIDLENRTISNDNFKYRLTIVEYMILKTLIENLNQTVSKDLLIQDVWDKNLSATDNALGIHISRLRKKTKTRGNKQIIETVWGVGYRFNSKED